jgi:hypothetical protein
MVLALAFVSVEAASFDGTYNYVYTLNGPSGRETHRVDSGFIVSGGRISSNPAAFSGSVSSSGTVSFTGPSPYGSPSASFTGSIKADGTGGGNYRDPQGLVGTWSVVRVSGGGGGLGGFSFLGIVEAMLNFLYTFSLIGEAIGLSGTLAASVGAAAVILVFVIGISFLTTRGSRRGKSAIMDKRGAGEKPRVHYDFSQQRPYEASEAPSGTTEAPASFIGVPPGPESPPIGLHVERPALPDRFDLRSVWGIDGVRLDWVTPDFDPEKFEMYYDGSSTAPLLRNPTSLTPDYISWSERFEQTYRWSTDGDIPGYRVDALFRDLNPDGPTRVVRVGGTTRKPIG